MTAHQRYISSVLRAFSTFCENEGVSVVEKKQLTEVLEEYLAKKKDFSVWDIESGIKNQESSDSITTQSSKLIAKFLTTHPPYQTSIFLHEYLLALKGDGCSPATVRNYRSDINQFLSFTNQTEVSKSLAKPKLVNFVRYQKQKGLKDSSIQRKLKVINQFGQWMKLEGILERNPVESTDIEHYLNHESRIMNQEGSNLQAHKPQIQDTRYKIQSSPKVYFTPEQTRHADAQKRQERRARTKSRLNRLTDKIKDQTRKLAISYLNFALIILFFLGVAVFGYQQFFSNVEQKLAYPSSLTRAGRVLSFQGRLTDTAQNPITTATNFTFTLHDDLTAGSELWNSGTCSITPDQDGIFSTGLGDDCGSEIDDSVFTENANIWLEVGVAGETLAPRQPIRTVAYAINSETLQGYPASASAVENTVLVMDNSGNVVLGNTNPMLQATGDSFTIEAQSMTLQTASGSDGDIILAPDGLGEIIAQSYLSAPGATFSATYAAGVPLTVNAGPTATANTLEVNSNGGSGGDYLVVDESGYVGIGTTNPNSTLHIETSDNYAATFSRGTNSKLLIGNSPDYTRISSTSYNGGSYADLMFETSAGGTMYLDGANVGIGTTGPAYLLDVAGTFSANSVNVNDAYTLPTSDGTTNYIMQTNGSGTVSWVDPTTVSASTNYWQLTGEQIHAKNALFHDLMIGGTSTASAKFYAQANTGNASMSGSLTIGQGGQIKSQYGPLNLAYKSGADAWTTGLTLTEQGNVGIGTINPTALLQIKGNSVADSSGNLTQIKLDVPSVGGGSGGYSNHALYIQPSGTGGGGANSSGTLSNYGIRTGILRGSPPTSTGVLNQYQAYVFVPDTANGGGGTNNYGLYIAGNGGSGASNYSLYNSSTANSYFAGNVAIGTTSPGYLLDVAGTFSANSVNVNDAYTFPTADGTANYIMQTDGSGTVTWVDPTSVSASTNYWQLNNEQISAKNALWHDLMIGGTSTASATFYAQANTGDASMSGSLTVGQGQQIKSQYGPLNLAYKSGADAWTTGLTLTEQGYVGIGTTSPSDKFEVIGNILSNDQSSSGKSLIGSVNNYPGIWFGSNATAPSVTNYAFLYDQSGTGTILNTPSGQHFSFRINNGNYMRLSSSGGLSLGNSYWSTDPGLNNMIIEGNVGIGTTSPETKLHVASGDILLSNNQQIAFEDSAGTNRSVVSVDTSNNVVFGNYSALGATQIRSTGSLTLFGQGSTESLELNSSGAIFNDTGADKDFTIEAFGVTNAFFLQGSDGYVGIGTNLPAYLLDVAGTFSANSVNVNDAYTLPTADGTTNYIMQTNGSGTVSWVDPTTVSASTNYWQLNNEQISAKNALWHDLMIGGTATSSATFYAQANTGDGYFGGNLGIGTTSPEGGLHIWGGSAGTYTPYASADNLLIEQNGSAGMTIITPDASTGNMFFGSPSRQIGSKISWNFSSSLFTLGTGYAGAEVSILSGNSVEAVRIDGSGNVGIGTTNPNHKLEVINGSGFFTRDLSSSFFGGTPNIAQLQVADTADTTRILAIGYSSFLDKAFLQGNDVSTSYKDILLNPLGGNIGIGTTTPNDKLEILSTSDAQLRLAYDGSNYTAMQVAADGGNTWSALGTDADLNFDFSGATDGDFSVNTDDLFVDSTNGNIGIGTTIPSQALHIYNATNTSAIHIQRGDGATLRMFGGATTGGFGTYSNHNLALMTNNTTQLTIDTSGNVGIGTTSPSTLLQLGTSGTTAGTLSLAGSTSGLVTIDTAAAAGTWSLTLPTGAGSSGQVLSTDGSGNTSWTDALTASSVYWTLTNEQIHAKNALWHDLLIGGTSTSSASIALQANTGDASMSGSLTIGQGEQIKSQYGPLNLAYKSGADAWTTGITLQDGTGNVGIGTTDPKYGKLDIRNTDADASEGINLWPGSGTTSRLWTSSDVFLITRGITPTNGIALDSSGNIGIGTTSPQARFHIITSGTAGTPAIASTTNAVIQDAGGSSRLSIISANTSRTGINFGDTDLENTGSIDYDHSDNSLRFKVNGVADSVLIDSSGHVGIGTSAPAPAVGSRKTLEIRDDTNGAEFRLRGGGAEFRVDAVAGLTQFASSNGDEMRFFVNNGSSSGFAIETDGDIVIGDDLNNIDAIAQLSVIGNTDQVQLGVKAHSTQTTNLTEWQNSSGTVLSSISGSGVANLAGLTINSAYTFPTADGTSNYILQTDGSGTVTWVDPTTVSASTNYWQLNNEQISAKNALFHDLMIGGTSTSSATIALQANTGDASMSGSLTIGQGEQIKSQYGPLNLAYKSGADAWSTGLTLTEQGYVGVGTTAPSYKLDVSGDIRVNQTGSYRMFFGGNGNRPVLSNNIDNSLQIGDPAFTSFVINTSGLVGIGTTSPNDKLEILSTSDAQLRLAYDTSNYTAMQVAADGGNTWSALGTDADLNFDFSGATDGDFSVNSDDLFVDTSAGRVGIGTTSPISKLEIFQTADSTNEGLTISRSGYNSGYFWLDSVANVLNITRGTTAGNGIAINNSGYVGIGTTAPSTLLQLGTSGTTAGTLSLAGSTSGLVTIDTAAAAGTWSFTLPTTGGTADYVLTTDGSGNTSWTDPVSLAGGTNYWTLTGEQIHPKNALFHDLMIGGTSTSSATIALQANTGDASMSGSLTIGQGEQIKSQYGPLNLAYKSGADTWSTGLTLNEQGYVGIGTTSPASKLQVNTATANSSALTLKTTDDSTTNNIFEIVKSTDANLAYISLREIGLEGSPVVRVPSSGTGTLFLGNTSNTANTASGNFFAGTSAGANTTSGGYNNFLGYETGYTNTTGYQNNFIGSWAGYSNENGRDNNFIGTEAGYYNTSGTDNNFMGYVSGYLNETGSGNNFIGYSTGTDNISGNYNNFIGYQAGANNSVGNNNIAIGFDTGRYNSTGSENVAIGSNALRGTVGNNNNNTALGTNAGYANTTGSNNLFLGHSTAYTNTTGSNNIVIGYDIDLPSASSNNMLNIGNLLFGTNIDGTNTTLSSGNIGIGTSTPVAKFDLTGAVTGKALAIFNETGDQDIFTASASGTTKFIIDNSGQVGIGGTAPSEALDVTGNIKVSGTTEFNSIAYTWPASQTSNYVLQTDGSGNLSWVDANAAASDSIYWTLTNQQLHAKNALWNDVLIGGTSTSSATIALQANTGDASMSGSLTIGQGEQIKSQYGPLNLAYKSGADAWTTGLTIDEVGNVGLGSTTTNDDFSIYRDSGSAGISLDSASANAYIDFKENGTTNGNIWWDGSSNYFGINSFGTNTVINNSGGNVGIGTTNPSEKLDVSGNILSSGTIYSTESTANIGSGIYAKSINPMISIYDTNASSAWGITSVTAGSLRFANGTEGTTGTTRVSILSTGELGIGTETPSSLLSVGSSSQFQINSSGIISSIDGVAHTIDDNAGNLRLTSNSTSIELNDNVTFAGTTTINSIEYTWPASLTSSYVLQTDGSGNLSWVDPTSFGGGGSSYFTLNNEQLYPTNYANLDLLIGGTSTASASFYAQANTGNGYFGGTLNIASGNTYQINGTDVLSSTTLGSGVVTSSLTTVGALNSGSITSGFGNIDIGSSNLDADGTITFAGLGTGTDNTVLILNGSNQVTTDEIDSRVWGTSLVDGSGTANYVARFSDSDTLTTGLIYDTGTYVGIGTTLPTASLNVESTGDLSGTAKAYGVDANIDFTNSSSTVSNAIKGHSLYTTVNLTSAETSGDRTIYGTHTGLKFASANTFNSSTDKLIGLQAESLIEYNGLSGPTMVGLQATAGGVTYRSNYAANVIAGNFIVSAGSSGSDTYPSIKGINIETPTDTATVTVTDSYGLYIEDQTLPNGTNTNTPYGIYQAGTGNYNYFAGNVGIGDTSPASLLTVGNGDLFQVNSSGIIANIDGVAHTIDDNGGNLRLSSNSTSIELNDNVTFGGTTTINSIEYTWPASQGSDYLLQTDGSGNLSWVSTASLGLVNYWGLTNEQLHPQNALWHDLLLGGTSTASANIVGQANTGYLRAQRFEDTANTDYYLDPAATGTSLTVAGSVGIGTTSPGAKLEVTGGTDNQNILFGNYGTLGSTSQTWLSHNVYRNYGAGTWGVTDGGSGTSLIDLGSSGANNGYIAFGTGNVGTTPTERMRIDNAGNVGIGTTVPTHKLTIAGASSTISNTSGDITIDSASGSIDFSADSLINFAQLQANNGSAATPSYSFQNDTDTGFYLSTTGEISFSSGGTQRATFDASGLQLGVAGSTAGNLSLAGSTSGVVTIDTAAAAGTWTLTLPTTAGTSGYILSTDGSGNTSWIETYLQINSNLLSPNSAYGDVASFALGGTASTSADIVLNADGSAVFNEQGGDSDFRIEGDTQSNLFFADASTDRIGVGTATPAYPVHIHGGAVDNEVLAIDSNNGATGLALLDNGTQRWRITNADSGDRLYIQDEENNNGVYMLQDGTSWVSTSDIRLKENISTEENLLDRISNIRTTSYNFIANDDSNREIGMIAQELEPYFPEVVNTSDTEYWGINYDRLGAIALGGIKEQYQLFQNIDQKVTNLESLISLDTTGSVVIDTPTTGDATLIIEGQNITDRISAFTTSFIANLKAGIINTSKLIADLRIQTPEIQTDIISPLSGDDVTIQLTDNTGNSQLEIKNANDEIVTTINSTGDASFSGQLTAKSSRLENLITTDATVSGTADIESARIKQLEAKVAQLEDIKAQTAELITATVSGTLYANNIDGFQDKVADAIKEPSLLETLLSDPEPASHAASVASLFEIVEETGFTASGAGELNLSLADLNLDTTDISINASAAFINQYFEVNGTGYISDSLGVQNNLYIGEKTVISNGIIEYKASSSDDIFAIQPSGTGTLALMKDLVILDETGLVTINGDVSITGNLEVQDTLLTDLLKPTDYTNPLQVQVAGVATESGEVQKSRFEIINELGTPVATISAEGKADFAGGIGLGSEDLTATTSAEVISNTTSGKATIQSYSTETIINSPLITEDSLIYVTPIGSTANQVLYVKEQIPEDNTTEIQEGQFTVGLDSALTADVKFNWWIIN